MTNTALEQVNVYVADGKLEQACSQGLKKYLYGNIIRFLKNWY